MTSSLSVENPKLEGGSGVEIWFCTWKHVEKNFTKASGRKYKL